MWLCVQLAKRSSGPWPRTGCRGSTHSRGDWSATRPRTPSRTAYSRRSAPWTDSRTWSRGPAWLTSILVNTCRDRLRARARRPQEVSFDEAEDFSLYRKIADEDPFPYSDSLHLDFLGEFGPEDVRAVLASLPDLYRIPLMLTYMDGFATKEVAGMLGAPLGTVLARLHRGRKLFEKAMWDYAEEHGLLGGSS
jgi:RNA polymerase sigma-70 factor, ECF subfamily